MKLKDYNQMMSYLLRRKDTKKPTLKDRPVRKPGAVPPKTNTIKIDPVKIDISGIRTDLNKYENAINTPRPEYKLPKQEKLEGLESILNTPHPFKKN